jgi:hypothetical protein
MNEKMQWLISRRRSQKSIADLAKENVEKQLSLYFDDDVRNLSKVHVIPKNMIMKDVYGEFKKIEFIADFKTRLIYRQSRTGELIKLEEARSQAAETLYLIADGLDKINAQEPTPVAPPNAEYILHLFLRGDDRDAVIGDLVERYAGKYERFGERRAKVWFYSQVLRSLWPLLKRLVTRASGLVALGEWIRRHVS